MDKYGAFPSQTPSVRPKSAIYTPKRDDEHPCHINTAPIFTTEDGWIGTHSLLLSLFSASCESAIGRRLLVQNLILLQGIYLHTTSVYTICLVGQKRLNPPAKSKEVLVAVVVVLFAFYLIGFRVACMDASNETYFKLQELARKKINI